METLASRYRNLVVLGILLIAQLLLLAYQLRRNQDVPLVRNGTIFLVTPVQKSFHFVTSRIAGAWHEYVGLRGARRDKEQLAGEVGRLKLANRSLQEEVNQARRLRALLDLKQQTAAATVVAQVIGSGADQAAHLVTIDKGQNAGLKPDMPVMVPDGVVGKVLHVFPNAAQVLLLTDAYSGVACLLEDSRIHGVLKGQSKPLATLAYVSNGDAVGIGQRLLTSGEDQVFPKGLPVGVVVATRPGVNFQQIDVQPLARLNRLEEVLVIVSTADVGLDAPAGPAKGPAALSSTVSKDGTGSARPEKPAPPTSPAIPATPAAVSGNPLEAVTPSVATPQNPPLEIPRP
jgi:rod shape-determining protein MreC